MGVTGGGVGWVLAWVWGGRGDMERLLGADSRRILAGCPLRSTVQGLGFRV